MKTAQYANLDEITATLEPADILYRLHSPLGAVYFLNAHYWLWSHLIPSSYSCRQHIHADVAASVVGYDRNTTA